jgi:hypothetical protein
MDNNIKKSMDKIEPSERAQERVLELVRERAKSKPSFATKNMMWLTAAVAACVMLAAGVVFSGIFADSGDPGGEPIVQIESGFLEGHDSSKYQRLYLNIDRERWSAHGIYTSSGFFSYELTNEELFAAVPGFERFAIERATLHIQNYGESFSISMNLTRPGKYRVLQHTKITIYSTTEPFWYEDGTRLSNIHGIDVNARVFVPDSEFRRADDITEFNAYFRVGNIHYGISINDIYNSSGYSQWLETVVNEIILSSIQDGLITNLSAVVIPDLSYLEAIPREELTLKQAYDDPEFGMYLPRGDWVKRDYIDRNRGYRINNIGAKFGIGGVGFGYGSLWWAVSERMDIHEGRGYVDWSEVTLDYVKSMAEYMTSRSGETEWWSGSLRLRLDDVVIDISSMDLSPQEVWEILQETLGGREASHGTVEANENQPLVWNEIDRMFSITVSIKGRFMFDLSDRELFAIFPTFENFFPIHNASAQFYKERGLTGAVITIEKPDAVNHFDSLTTIRIGGGDTMFVSYDSDPAVSDIWGVEVVAGTRTYNGVSDYDVQFELDGIHYKITYRERGGNIEEQRQWVEMLTNKIIHDSAAGGIKADLSLFFRQENFGDYGESGIHDITLEQAFSDPDFGMYLPKVKSINDVYRFDGYRANHLAFDFNNIHWNVSERMEHHENRGYVDWQDMTLDYVKSRAWYRPSGEFESSRWFIGSLRVGIDDVVIDISSIDVEPERIWEILQETLGGE